MQRDLVAGILGDMQPIVHRVGRSRGNQPNIYNRPRGPGVALVDGIAVLVDLQGTVEVRAGLDRPLTVVLNHATPKQRLAFVVSTLQLHPGVVSVDRAAGEKVAQLLGAHDHIYPHRITTTNYRLYPVQRSGDRPDFPTLPGRDFRLRLLANRKSRGKLSLSDRRFLLRAIRRKGEDVDRHYPVLQEILDCLELLEILISRGHRRVRRGKAMGVYIPVDIAHVFRLRERHVAVGTLRRLRWGIKGARAFTRNAAGLPVVILVEASDPAIAVDGHVQVDLAACRTESRRAVAY